MAWAYMAAFGMSSVIFTDLTRDGSSRKNLEVLRSETVFTICHRCILSPVLFMVFMDSDI